MKSEIYLIEKLEKLNFSEFTSRMTNLKIVNIIYTNRIKVEYYLILGPGKLRKQFVENLFEFVYNIA